MLNLENFAGTLFKGKFYKNPEEVVRELKALRARPKDFTKTEAASIRKNPKHFKFGLRILGYNQDSGLFVAGASDDFGESGIVGVVRDEEIQFNKIYVRDTLEFANEKPNFERNFKRFQYFGEMTQSDGKISAKGRYLVGSNELLGGFWEIHSVKR